jgi:hypothetical protein
MSDHGPVSPLSRKGPAEDGKEEREEEDDANVIDHQNHGNTDGQQNFVIGGIGAVIVQLQVATELLICQPVVDGSLTTTMTTGGPHLTPPSLLAFGGMTHRQMMNQRRRARTSGKKIRFQVFAQFLLDTYGYEYLRHNGGVLDVAGGRGRMALELCLERNVSCTVVDPRYSKFSNFTIRRIVKLASEEKEDDCGKPKGVMTQTSKDQSGATVVACPILLPLSELFSTLFSGKDDEHPSPRERTTSCVTSYMRRVGFEFHKCLFDERYCQDVTRNNSKWTKSAVVIGMHPDEATETIVDEAIQAGKPFAVVPCCVFPNLFPDRKFSDGRTVRTLEDFIRYLSEKHSDIRVQTLDFPGCNTVLYMKK